MTNFEKEFGTRKMGFLIRKFEERDDRNRLVNTVRETFRQKGFTIVDASEKTLHPEAWGNVREFLEHCSFGVIIIDNLSPYTAGFNPNVFLEIGYLLALKKNILILIQNSLAQTLPTDIKPFIYTSFDSQDLETASLKNNIIKWIDNTINYNPGYLTVYVKGDFVNFDLLTELKGIICSMSNCVVIENDTITKAEQDELDKNKISYNKGVKKIVFKTQTKQMAEKFSSDFELGFYNNVPLVSESVLLVKSGFVIPNYVDGGIHTVFNDDKEAIVYCQNEGIENCKEEELYAYNFFKTRKTKKPSEVEIVILPKFDNKNTFLYVSNFYHRDDWHNVKICHYPKESSRNRFADVKYRHFIPCLVRLHASFRNY